MNDKDCYCFRCNTPAYNYELSDTGLCWDCTEDSVAKKQKRTWGQCLDCGKAMKYPPKTSLCWDCMALRARNQTVALTNATAFDEPTAEDMDYVYRSLGIPNPNK